MIWFQFVGGLAALVVLSVATGRLLARSSKMYPSAGGES